MKFVPVKRKLIGRSGKGPSAAMTAVIAGTIGLYVALSILGQFDQGSFLRSHLPHGNSDWFWAFAVPLPVIVVLGYAIGSYFWELNRAALWVQAPGRILRSEMAAERRRVGNEAEKIENVPAIEYEFEAGGSTVRGSRIGIAGDSSGEDFEATLKRYPKGATVTVFYDPDDPANCTLERSGSKELTLTGCLAALALLAGFCAAAAVLAFQGPAFVRAHFPRAGNAEFSVFAFGFGTLALLFFLGIRRIAGQAAGWPTARGSVVSSGVESYRERSSSGRSMTTSYRPVVEYVYEVNGQNYRGNQITLMVQSGGMQGHAEGIAKKYPAGATVTVHYDPKNPGNAALEIPRGATLFPLIIALFAFALAAWQAGLFG